MQFIVLSRLHSLQYRTLSKVTMICGDAAHHGYDICHGNVSSKDSNARSELKIESVRIEAEKQLIEKSN